MHPEAQVVAVVIRLGLILFAIILVWQRVLLPTMTEHFRQNVFALRRELFLYMADGHVAASEPAYGYVRHAMNVVLRISERFTLSRLVLLVVFYTKYGVGTDKGDVLVARIDDRSVREELQRFRVRLSLAIWWHAILMSPATLPFILALEAWSVIRNGLFPKTAKKRAHDAIARTKVSPRVVEADLRALSDDDDDGPWSVPPPPPRMPAHAHA